MLLALALWLILSNQALAEEDLYRQLVRQCEQIDAELESVLRDLDYRGGYGGGYGAPYHDRALDSVSLRRNATVTVGGELRTIASASRTSVPAYTQYDPLFGSASLGKNRSTSLSVATARIFFDVAAGRRWRAFVDMNLQGNTGLQRVERTVNRNLPGRTPSYGSYQRVDDDMLVRAAYVELLKDHHSGFGFKAGVMELPFGIAARPDLIGRSFTNAPDLTASYLMNPQSKTGGFRLPHASAFLDPVAAVMVSYEMRDIIRFEAALFQERESDSHRSFGYGRYNKYRTESNPLQSFQLGFSIQPLEDWELTGAFRNRNSRTRGIRSWSDSPYRSDFMGNLADGVTDPSWDPATRQWSNVGTGPGFGSRSNEQAMVIGAAVEIPYTGFSVYFQYAHGWNQGFSKHINSDDFDLGLSYRLTPRLTLYGQAEWLHVKDKSWLAQAASGDWERDVRNHRLYRFMLGAEYEMADGLTLEAGWQYEWWRYASNVTGPGKERRSINASTLYLGSRFLF